MSRHQIAINILGTRGVPAAHSGFEFFADHFARWLAVRGHDVTVYCQGSQSPRGEKLSRWEDSWEGVRRVHFTTRTSGTLATMEFDLRSALDVLRRPGVDLVLGYNTAVFNLIQKFAGRSVWINMDGIEWIRAKWSLAARAWFYVNELVGANAFHPIADHPEMAKHVKSRSLRNVRMIPYGAPTFEAPPEEPVRRMGIEPGHYFISIARIVPENSILEIVRAFSSINTKATLVVLGPFDERNGYHVAVKSAASANVLFPGPIFEPDVVRALRFHALAYLHGHTVGGTNPSLVEALAAGSAVIAHDNRFNRWTAGAEQIYFSTVEQCALAMQRVESDSACTAELRIAAKKRHEEAFRLDAVHQAYLDALQVGYVDKQ